MPDLIIHPSGPLRGSLAVPGDKSITHRALMLAALADGHTFIEGWVPAEVCLATLRCMEMLGAEVGALPPLSPAIAAAAAGTTSEAIPPSTARERLHVRGKGLHGLAEPADVLHCAGSGTTIRLLAGLLAGQPFTTVLTGADPLRRRPMGRIAEPLRLMGATVLGRDGGRLPPLTIRGGNLKGIEYRLPVASAQVKSAILLAGLFAEGETVIHEPGPSRDHTERMLRWYGVQVMSEGPCVRLQGGQRLVAPADARIVVPGDFSSAAFPLVAAAIVPGSHVTLRRVGANPTRTGLWDLLSSMGAEVELVKGQERTGRVSNPGRDCFAPSGEQMRADSVGVSARNDDALQKRYSPEQTGEVAGAGEPMADLAVRGSELAAVEVSGDLVVRAIDEFPVFAVAATQAAGTTVVREAKELRVKESDRIASVAGELRKLGAAIEERPDGMIIHGPVKLRGAEVECHRDHRLAMALAVAGLAADGPTTVRGAEAINDSFPGFVEAMQALGADMRWSE